MLAEIAGMLWLVIQRLFAWLLDPELVQLKSCICVWNRDSLVVILSFPSLSSHQDLAFHSTLLYFNPKTILVCPLVSLYLAESLCLGKVQILSLKWLKSRSTNTLVEKKMLPQNVISAVFHNPLTRQLAPPVLETSIFLWCFYIDVLNAAFLVFFFSSGALNLLHSVLLLVSQHICL